MKGLLAVSFGTSYPDVADRTIGAIERALAAAFPDRVPYSAWTSGFICKKVEREGGAHHMQMQEALERIAADGVDDLLVQPTFLMQSHEHSLMLEALEQQGAGIAKVRVGDTLLASDDDCLQLARAIGDAFPDLAEDEALVLMGHGSEFGGNEVYTAMQGAFMFAGMRNVIVGTVEGTPDFAAVQEAVAERAPRRVLLAPFMIVAGDHANNDLAGDEPDSWMSQLAAGGFACEPVLRGLGEFPSVQNVFVTHAQRALVQG